MSSIEEAFKAKIVALGTAAGSRVFREVIEQEPVMPAISSWKLTCSRLVNVLAQCASPKSPPSTKTSASPSCWIIRASDPFHAAGLTRQ